MPPHSRLGWPFIARLNLAFFTEEQVLEEDEDEVEGCWCAGGDFEGEGLFF